MQHVIPTEKAIVQWFWLFVAGTTPLFAMGYLRFNIGIMHAPLPVIGILVIIWIGFLSLAVHFRPLKVPKGFRLFALFCYAFFFWHLLSLFFVEPSEYALAVKHIVKLVIGMACFWTILIAFPRSPKSQERFWRVILWSSTVVIGYFIYCSVRRGNMFLGAQLGTDALNAAEGRNQVAWYVSAMFPFALLSVWSSSRKWLVISPLFVITLAVIYVASRFAWAGAFIAVCCILFIVGRVDRARFRRIAIVVVLTGSVTVLLAVRFLSSHADLFEIARRFAWILNPSAIPELHSFESRGSRIHDAFQGFLTAPFFGVGLKTSLYQNSESSHNDYASILVELGAVGEMLFLGLLLLLARRCLVPPLTIRKDRWVALASRGAFVCIILSVNFYNIYTSPHFWFFLAYCVVAVESEVREDTLPRRSPYVWCRPDRSESIAEVRRPSSLPSIGEEV